MTDYNPLWDRLVGQEGEEDVAGYVAYAIYKKSKREWVRQLREDNGRAPNDAETKAYSLTWTPQLISAAQESAEAALAAFSEEAIDNARAGIVEDALKGQWWKGVINSVVANLIYTLLLLAVVINLKLAGVDLISDLKTIH